jgi:hypothetical protein
MPGFRVLKELETKLLYMDLTNEQKLEFASHHDWTWCIYQGTAEDCHGRLCKFANRERSAFTEEERAFWGWVTKLAESDPDKYHPDIVKLSLMDWVLAIPELRELFAAQVSADAKRLQRLARRRQRYAEKKEIKELMNKDFQFSGNKAELHKDLGPMDLLESYIMDVIEQQQKQKEQ